MSINTYNSNQHRIAFFFMTDTVQQENVHKYVQYFNKSNWRTFSSQNINKNIRELLYAVHEKLNIPKLSHR